MASQDDRIILDAFRRRFAGAVFSPENLKPLLADLAEFLDADDCQLMIADGEHKLLQSSFARDYPEDLLQLEYDLQEINPRVRAIPLMKSLKAYRDQDFITRDEILKDQTYQEMIYPIGLGHFSGVPVVNSNSLVAGIAMYRHQDGDAFSDSEVRRQELLMQALDPVFSLVNRLEEAQVKTVSELLGKHRPMLITDARGRVRQHNSGVEHLLETGAINIASDRRLRFAIPADATAYARTCKAGGRFLVHTPTHRLVATGERILVDTFGVAGELTGSAAVVFNLVDAPDILDEALARQAFGLTPAEARVASLILQGLSVRQINDRRDTTENTTRTILKRLMAKVGISRQSQLRSALTAFILPPGND